MLRTTVALTITNISIYHFFLINFIDDIWAVFWAIFLSFKIHSLLLRRSILTINSYELLYPFGFGMIGGVFFFRYAVRGWG